MSDSQVPASGAAMDRAQRGVGRRLESHQPRGGSRVRHGSAARTRNPSGPPTQRGGGSAAPDASVGLDAAPRAFQVLVDRVDVLEEGLKQVERSVRTVERAGQVRASSRDRATAAAPAPLAGAGMLGDSIDPVVLQEINRRVDREVARQVARQVAKTIKQTTAEIEQKVEQGMEKRTKVMLKTIEQKMEQTMRQSAARERELAAKAAAAQVGLAERSVYTATPYMADTQSDSVAPALRRMEQIENHVELNLRRYRQEGDELALRVDTVEKRLRDTPPASAGRAAPTLHAEDFGVRLAEFDVRLEEVYRSQEQDTSHLNRRIGQLEEHQQAMQTLSDGAVAQVVGGSDDLGQQQLEHQERSRRKSLRRLEKGQAELESKMDRLLENPAIASTLADRAADSDSAAPPASPTQDAGTMSPRWAGSDGSDWDMVVDGVGAVSAATPAELRALELKVDEMRRDTDRCQELLKFCSKRLNLRSVRAVRVDGGGGRAARGDETTATGSQWKMALVPGVPVRRQVKSQRRWKTADWKPPHLVRAAKAAGVLDIHGSVAKARAKKLYQDVARARAAGAIARHGPTLRDMFLEARAFGAQELGSINQELHEAHDKNDAELEVRAEMQAAIRDAEARLEELERALADAQEQSEQRDQMHRALEGAVDELSGWQGRADEMQQQIEDVSDRCHQTASAVADQQLGMKALETIVDSLPAQRAASVAAAAPPTPAAGRKFIAEADWLKDASETEPDQRLLRFVDPEMRGGGSSTNQGQRALSPQKQRSSDHLTRLQDKMDKAIGSEDPSKVVAVLRDVSVVEADGSMSARPDHTFVASLAALKNHAASLCDRGCEEMEALLGTLPRRPQHTSPNTCFTTHSL